MAFLEFSGALALSNALIREFTTGFGTFGDFRQEGQASLHRVRMRFASLT
jgi:hypothetical protein